MKPTMYKFLQYPRGMNKGGVLDVEICPTISCSSWENNCFLIEIYDKTCIFWSDCFDNPYEAMISRIANKIKWGELNKEYLEELCGKH